MENDLIQNVSDTALWIAAYRSQETDRPDAVFKDPLAKKLAGEKGKQIVAETPHTNMMAFAMVARTTAIDRLVLNAIDRGVDTIINLGAGLDTRPYRMQLPSQLKWIEVDFPHMILYKTDLLANDKPVCYLERIGADLSQDAERKALFARLGAATQKALIITEGVIAYLSNDQAAALSADLYAIPSFKYWIQDISQGKMRKNKETKALSKKLKNSPFRFSAPDPIGFFGKHGWKVAENIYILDEADRIGRRLPMSFPWGLLMKIFRKKIRDVANKTYGYIMFGKD
jgi:methyltransferase (TIGR00027 family)